MFVTQLKVSSIRRLTIGLATALSIGGFTYCCRLLFEQIPLRQKPG
jgi:hypothetical protein